MGLQILNKLGFFLLALCQVLPSISSAPTVDSGLFLTPLIRTGELEKARAAAADSAKLSNIKSDREVKSYSGYLTIDEAKESNLFFWFFPAEQNPEKAPVILWVNDIPGFSCLQGIFLETGPFEVDDSNALKDRKHSWTKTHSMLYIDAPVGSGFSYAKDESAYANSSDEDAEEVMEALKQFFTMFPEFRKRDFYMAGESYASTSIPYIAKKINAAGGINLKGFVIGSPFISTDQIFQGQEYFDFGLFDEKQRDDFNVKMRHAFNLGLKGKIKESEELSTALTWGENSLFHNYTGIVETRSALTANPPAEIAKFAKFLETKEAHNYLHVGLHKYNEINFEVLRHFFQEFLHSHDKIIEDLLNQGMRILFYAPQFDLLVTQKGVSKAVNRLKWKGARKFASAPRKVWRVKDDVAGYTKRADNFTFAVVRNAGSFAIMDQPEWIFDLVEKFFYNQDHE